MEPRLIDDRTDSRQRLVAISGNRVSEHEHRAGVSVGQTQQHPDQCRLSRPVRAQVAERTPPGNKKLDTVDSNVVPESLRQSVGLHSPPARRIVSG